MIADISSLADRAAGWLGERWPTRPLFGIILGTGSGLLADEIRPEAAFDYGEIPGFPRSTAQGHKGRLVCGNFAGQPVVAMQGRFHLYEGYDVDLATLPVHVMQRMGVRTLFISNAAGGVSPRLNSGEIMLIHSMLDFMFRSTPSMAGEVAGTRPVHRSDTALDKDLIVLALRIGRAHGMPLQEGVYASLLGPNYETRAEYRFLRRIGADVVGMSTVPEVAVASALGMRVLGMSIVSNVAKPDLLESTSGEEVIDAAQVAAPNLKRLVEGMIDALSQPDATSR